MKKIKLVFSIFLLGHITLSYSQENFEKKFQNVIESEDNYNTLDKLLRRSRNNNVLNFMELSYSFNANTLMYTKTKDIKYIEIGNELVSNVFNVKENKNRFDSKKWRFSSTTSRHAHLVGKEVFLFEGYLLRYIAEYLFVTKDIQKDSYLFKSALENLESRFIYWHKESQKKFKDNSDLLGVRVHMGAQKASLALFLYKMSNSEQNRNIYKSFYDEYNKGLKQNLRIVKENNYECYIWNSTWDNAIANQVSDLKRNNKYPTKIQDVSHGNHVIQFMIDSYILEEGAWDKRDLERVVNTLKFKISNDGGFADNVDGSASKDSSVKNTGWKQSDGWMKLIKYDKALVKIYESFYDSNKSKIDNSMWNLQFYAVLDAYAN